MEHELLASNSNPCLYVTLGLSQRNSLLTVTIESSGSKDSQEKKVNHWSKIKKMFLFDFFSPRTDIMANAIMALK